MPLKHILSILRISEMVYGHVKSAMELKAANGADVFWFTDSLDNSFSFVIEAKEIRFENIGEVMMTQS